MINTSVEEWAHPLTRVVLTSPSRSRACFRSSSHHFAENQQHNEDNKQPQGYQHEAQARIVVSFLNHGSGHVMYFFHALHIIFDRSPRDAGSAVQSLSRSLPRTVWYSGFCRRVCLVCGCGCSNCRWVSEANW